MIAIIWRYEVDDAHRAEFETAYGPTGLWAKLFARSTFYEGTELLRAADGAYLTIDRWRSKADFEAFLAAHRGEYDALDARTEAWTRSEQRVGDYEVLPG